MKPHENNTSGGPVVIDYWINNSINDCIICSKKKTTKNIKKN